jgi:peptide-methionine (S)-S-oxide reductase
VGYAGGSTPNPTYRNIGDHTESLQVEFDPEVVSFEQLLDVFWSEHDPAGPRRADQYAHLAFWNDEQQRAAIAGSRRVVERDLAPGRTVTTRVVPLERFYVAEDYHQKYYLRNTAPLMREFGAMFGGDEAAFRESTAAARVNGALGGGMAPSEDPMAEIGQCGLSEQGLAELTRLAERSTGYGCRL